GDRPQVATLDHPHEEQIVRGIHPEPGAERAIPVIGTLADGPARTRRIEGDADVVPEANAWPYLVESDAKSFSGIRIASHDAIGDGRRVLAARHQALIEVI